MATLSEVNAANEDLRTRVETATAIFTGATQGIGLATLKAFATHIPKPRAIIVGRNRQRFKDELHKLASLNSSGEFIFLEAEVSLIKAIDAVCVEIKQLLASESADLLCMSQGYAPLEGREYTSEGLDKAMALVYFSRMRMIQNLIDSNVLKPTAKVVSVLAGARENKLFEDDLALDRNYSILNLRGHFATLTTLSHDDLAIRNSEMGFVHVFPGRVKTGLLQRSINGWLLWLLVSYVVEPLMLLWGMSPEESGARILWMALGPKFSKASWSLDYDGAESKSKWLERYRQNASLLGQIRAHNEQMFERATSD